MSNILNRYSRLPQSYSPGSFTIPAGGANLRAGHLILTTTERLTILGSGRLRVM